MKLPGETDKAYILDINFFANDFTIQNFKIASP